MNPFIWQDRCNYLFFHCTVPTSTFDEYKQKFRNTNYIVIKEV